MGIKLNGLSSGLDTESLVQALVSSYSITKDNLVKAQTKLSWKQDIWKELNTKIYDLYTKKLSDMRFSYKYDLKNSTISNSAYAKVLAGTGAVSGTQELKVDKLAASGYLTGGIISGTDLNGNSEKLKGSSKLSQVTGMSSMANSTINVTVDGKSKSINVGPDTTIDKFVSDLKGVGLTANFDETNQRFFINSKTSGAAHDFTLTAGNTEGLKAIQGLGLYTNNATDNAEYKKWAEYTSTELDALKEAAYKAAKKSYSNVAKSYVDKYNNASKIVKDYTSEQTLAEQKDSLNTIKSSLETSFESFAKKDVDGNYILDADGNRTYDVAAIEAAGSGRLDSYNAMQRNIANQTKNINTIESNMQIMATSSTFVNIGTDGKAVADAANANVISEADAYNVTVRTSTAQVIDDKVALAKEVMSGASGATPSSTAVRIAGEDAVIYLNGAKFTNNTSNFSVNGLTIQATAKTGSETVTITTGTDVDGIYNMIKDFYKDYNALIKEMDEKYNAPSSKGYEPLLDEEKSELSDKDVEKWEEKIKDSILRKDGILGSISNSFKTNMLKTFEIDGKKYNLSSFGISTSGYFTSGDNEKGVYHIDGDKEDSTTSGKTDKLKDMIAKDPDTVASFFSQLSTAMYTDLSNKMTSSSIRSAYTVYNDKQMSVEYSEYKTKIKTWESKVKTMEEFYYKKFTAMEKALASLNSKQSSLSGLLGSK